MDKVLFIITAKYPYGKGDSFVENEMRYLASVFDKIVIISNECNDPITKWIPENAVIERLSYELSPVQTRLSILSVFSKLFWQEMFNVKSIYKKNINSIIIKTALVSHWKSLVKGKILKSIIRKHCSSNDKVYAYSYWSNDMALTLTSIKKTFSEIKIFSRAHGWDVYFEANKANYLPFRKRILEQLDKVYFISNKGFNYYSSFFPELTNKMSISKLGVTGCKAKNSEKSLTDDTFTFVSCSHVLPIKRVNLIAEALSLINDTKIRWVHFGDGQLFSNLKEQCDELTKNKKNIQIELPGNIPNTEVLDFFASNHIEALINVSSTEGIPVSIMEAMGYGIPAIATDVGGTHEIVENGRNGFLLTENPSITEIAETIVRFTKMSEFEKMAIRDNAYETWQNSYDAEKNYRTFIEDII